MKRQWKIPFNAAFFVDLPGLLVQFLKRLCDWKVLPFSDEDSKSLPGEKVQKRKKRPEGRKKSAHTRRGIGGR